MSSITEITQLVLWERQSRVRMLADELLSCFFQDATVTTSWTNGSAQAYVSGARTRERNTRNPIINRLGAPVVHLNGQRAVVELPSTTTRWIFVNGVEAVLDSYMRLIYRVECRHGEWKIVDLTAINECDTLTPALPGADLHVAPEDVTDLRLSYRYLSYTKRQEGEIVSQELFGIDRPEEVDKLYESAFAWRDAQ